MWHSVAHSFIGASQMNARKFAERFFHKKFHTGRGDWPVATIAYYGPDNETATKVAVLGKARPMDG